MRAAMGNTCFWRSTNYYWTNTSFLWLHVARTVIALSSTVFNSISFCSKKFNIRFPITDTASRVISKNSKSLSLISLFSSTRWKDIDNIYSLDVTSMAMIEKYFVSTTSSIKSLIVFIPFTSVNLFCDNGIMYEEFLQSKMLKCSARVGL